VSLATIVLTIVGVVSAILGAFLGHARGKSVGKTEGVQQAQVQQQAEQAKVITASVQERANVEVKVSITPVDDLDSELSKHSRPD
jgi:hypothetical protein